MGRLIIIGILGWLTMVQAGLEDVVTIEKPDPSVIFENVGELYPTLNYGHVRVTSDIGEIINASKQICAIVEENEQLANYTQSSIMSQIPQELRNELTRENAVSNKYPSAPFSKFTYVINTNLRSKCEAAKDQVALVEEIFRSVLIASATQDTVSNRPRNRRQLAIGMAALSLLFSGYTIWEIQRLSSEVNALKFNQQHIIAAIRSLAEETGKIQQNFLILKNETSKIKRQLNIRTFEDQILVTAQLGLNGAGEIARHIDGVAQGLYHVLSGKLSPLLVDPAGLKNALSSMADVAKENGSNAISTVLPHIFELEASMYVHANREIVDIIVHVPLVALSSKRLLYKRSHIPYILPLNLEQVKPQLSIYDQQHAVWSIKQGSNYIAANEENTVVYELSKDDLDDCVKIGNNHYCRHLIRRRDSVQNSCEVALYKSRMKGINNLCEIEFFTIPETAVSISNRETLVYSEPQVVDVTCFSANGTALGKGLFPIKGVSKITLAKQTDCTVSTLRHQWRADIFLEISAKPRVLPIAFNITEVLGPVVQEFIQNARKVEINHYKPISMQKVGVLLNDMKEVGDDLGGNELWILWAVLAVLAVGVILGFIIMCYLKKRTAILDSRFRTKRGAMMPSSSSWADWEVAEGNELAIFSPDQGRVRYRSVRTKADPKTGGKLGMLIHCEDEDIVHQMKGAVGNINRN